VRAASYGFIRPALPSSAERPPDGTDWVHEIKHDGYRLMVRRDGAGGRLLTRNGHDWSARFPLILEAAHELNVRSCLIDGEAVCCDEKGLAVFERLRRKHDARAAFLYAFDLLELDGVDVRRESIETRKETLASVLRGARRGFASTSISSIRARSFSATPARWVWRASCRSVPHARLAYKFKNPAAPAAKREAEEDWGRGGR
jgi:bifunctional non-homologous end joining protein LigD